MESHITFKLLLINFLFHSILIIFGGVNYVLLSFCLICQVVLLLFHVLNFFCCLICLVLVLFYLLNFFLCHIWFLVYYFIYLTSFSVLFARISCIILSIELLSVLFARCSFIILSFELFSLFCDSSMYKILCVFICIQVIWLIFMDYFCLYIIKICITW